MFQKKAIILMPLILAVFPLITSCTSLLPTLPTVMLTVSKTLGIAPFSVTMQTKITLPEKPSDEAWTLLWDFGDGQMGEGAKVTHTYTQPGLYRAQLVASQGDDFSTERSVIINALVAPQFEITRYATGMVPMASAVIDLNLDGRNDLLSANAESHSISVFLANGQEFVSTPYAYPAIKSPSAALQPQAVTTGDINNDTLTDLIVINPPDNNLTLLFGNGLGGFQTPSGYDIPQPQQAVTGDFNGDNHQDVVVVGKQSNKNVVILMIGRGTGELMLGRSILKQSQITDMVSGDVDSDGDLDLVFSTQGFGVEALILINEGNGQFSAPIELLLPVKPNALTLLHANRDGYLDLMTTNVDGTLSLLLGDGQGAFAFESSLQTQLKQPTHPLSSDINGDGANDVVFQYDRSGKPNIGVLLGDGQGRFTDVISLEGVHGAAYPVLSHINNDRLKDLVLVNPETDELVVLINKTPTY